MKLSDIRPNEANPRKISGKNLKKLQKSIGEFGKMMSLRPIVVDESGVILGGNMRYRALQSLGYDEIPSDWIKVAEGLTEEEKRRFVIEDNVGFGDWDWEMLDVEWDIAELASWGLDVPNETETSKLSDGVIGLYYEPSKSPSVTLDDCVDTTQYDEKMKIIDDAEIRDEIRELFRKMATRFIGFDFEKIADYYTYKATSQERRVIEELRLVLIDSEPYIEQFFTRPS